MAARHRGAHWPLVALRPARASEHQLFDASVPSRRHRGGVAIGRSRAVAGHFPGRGRRSRLGIRDIPRLDPCARARGEERGTWLRPLPLSMRQRNPPLAGPTAPLFRALATDRTDAAPAAQLRCRRPPARWPGVARGRRPSRPRRPALAAEIYDPGRNRWTRAARMVRARPFASAVRLADGRVLVAGGEKSGEPLRSAEIYSPGRNRWSAARPMLVPRGRPSATLLHNGLVLVTGGDSNARD